MPYPKPYTAGEKKKLGKSKGPKVKSSPEARNFIVKAFSKAASK